MVTTHRMPTDPRFINLTGKTFDRLTVEEYAGRNKHRHNLWKCLCKCGKTVVVETTSLRTNHTRSCGCLHAESIGKRSVTHGHSRVGKKTAEYKSWSSMKWRCTNPKSIHWLLYGGRGITVCARWKDSFENFLADMGTMPAPGLSIDRFPDKDGNYEPGNCRWATIVEQANNKRNTRLVTFGERTMSIQQWEKHLGFPRSLLRSRLRIGWSVERAFTTPYAP